jgi:LysR family transcriptional regulator, chromosome initiation inhibitor
MGRGNDTRTATALTPAVSRNRDEALHRMFVRKVFRRTLDMPVHYVPTAADLSGRTWP